jgi:hypothetical protein
MAVSLFGARYGRVSSQDSPTWRISGLGGCHLPCFLVPQRAKERSPSGIGNESGGRFGMVKTALQRSPPHSQASADSAEPRRRKPAPRHLLHRPDNGTESIRTSADEIESSGDDGFSIWPRRKAVRRTIESFVCGILATIRAYGGRTVISPGLDRPQTDHKTAGNRGLRWPPTVGDNFDEQVLRLSDQVVKPSSGRFPS